MKQEGKQLHCGIGKGGRQLSQQVLKLNLKDKIGIDGILICILQVQNIVARIQSM